MTEPPVLPPNLTVRCPRCGFERAKVEPDHRGIMVYRPHVYAGHGDLNCHASNRPVNPGGK